MSKLALKGKVLGPAEEGFAGLAEMPHPPSMWLRRACRLPSELAVPTGRPQWEAGGCG